MQARRVLRTFVMARPSRSHLALMWFQTAQYAARSDLAFSVPLGDSSAGMRMEVGLLGLRPVGSNTSRAPGQWLRSEQMQARKLLRNCL